MMTKSLIAFLAIVLSANVALANGTKYTGISLEDDDFKKTNVPKKGDLSFELELLGYEDDRPHTYKTDLNGDGAIDFIFQSHDSVCGTGGCVYVVVDGKTFKKIGELSGGPPIVADQKASGHSMLIHLSYNGPDKADFNIWGYKQNKYVLVQTISSKGSKLVDQIKKFRRAK